MNPKPASRRLAGLVIIVITIAPYAAAAAAYQVTRDVVACYLAGLAAMSWITVTFTAIVDNTIRRGAHPANGEDSSPPGPARPPLDVAAITAITARPRGLLSRHPAALITAASLIAATATALTVFLVTHDMFGVILAGLMSLVILAAFTVICVGQDRVAPRGWPR